MTLEPLSRGLIYIITEAGGILGCFTVGEHIDLLAQFAAEASTVFIVADGFQQFSGRQRGQLRSGVGRYCRAAYESE